MFGLGLGELLVVLVIVLVLFNRRLPDIGESLGKSIRKFRRALTADSNVAFGGNHLATEILQTFRRFQ